MSNLGTQLSAAIRPYSNLRLRPSQLKSSISTQLPAGKWVEDFKVGRQYALKFWEDRGRGQAFALEFQQIILGMLSAAKNPKSPTSYSGIEAGFLLAIGELSRGAIHVQTLFQESHASERRTRRMDVTAAGHYTPNEWEFGVSHPG